MTSYSKIEKTLGYYDSAAQQYQNLIASEDTPYLAEFITLIAGGGRVLDLGCGPGHCAGEMARAGLSVDASDGSAEMVALATKLPGVRAVQALFSDLDETAIYDAIWANFSLLHAPRGTLPDCIGRIHQALKPQGLFHIGMKLEQQDGTDRLGRYYAYYSRDELVTMLADAGFTIVREELGAGKGMAGIEEPWIVIWARSAPEVL